MVNVYEFKKEHDNPRLLFPMLGLFFLISVFSLWIIAILIILYGGIISYSILLILLIYQFSLNNRNDYIFSFLVKCRIYNYFKSYKLIVEEELSDSKTLLCSHPHGIISLGMINFLLNDEFKINNLKICGTRFVRNLPLSGILARWLGLEGVDNKNFKNFMKEQRNILFVPGGFECATITDDKQDKTFIMKRKGFIKYALVYGYKIRPCYTFNENKLFYIINGFETIGLILNKIKFPGCFFYGRYGILPRNDVDLCTVIGKAIKFPTILKPSKEEIDKYHSIYLNELKSLYKRYVSKYGGSSELEFL